MDTRAVPVIREGSGPVPVHHYCGRPVRQNEFMFSCEHCNALVTGKAVRWMPAWVSFSNSV